MASERKIKKRVMERVVTRSQMGLVVGSLVRVRRGMGIGSYNVLRISYYVYRISEERVKGRGGGLCLGVNLGLGDKSRMI